MIVSEEKIISSVVNRISKLRKDPNLDLLFSRIENITQEWAIVGGFVRDSYLNINPNDIDIIIDSDRDVLIKDIFQGSNNITTTQFGGFRAKVSGVSFDIWTPKDSWAVKEGLVIYNGLQSFLTSINYNLDAIMVLPDKNIIMENEFKLGLEAQILKLEFTYNPFPKYLARKGKKLMWKYNVKPDERTKKFINNYVKL